MKNNTENFLVASLCNNDYGHLIEKALIEGKEWGLLETKCPILWKNFIVSYIMGYQLKKEVVSGSGKIILDNTLNIQKYLEKKLRITFERYAPCEDHDGGSAVLCLNSEVTWLY